MRRFQVGTVCVLVGTTIEPYIGKECTIVGAYDLYRTTLYGMQEGYMVTVQGHGDQEFFSYQEGLKLKRYPGQLHSWLTEKMDKLLAPNVDITVDLIRERGAV